MRFVPRCFDSRQQFSAWLEAARRGQPPVGGYCTDCTPQYQQQMIYARRCAHPGTTFDADGDGRRPGKEK